MRRGRALRYALAVLALAAIGGGPRAATDCKLMRVAEWPTRPGRDAPVIEGTINGQKVGIMLDTGSGTLLLRSAADRLGLTRHEARGHRVFGVGGETYVETTSVADFSVGQVTRKNWRVMVAGERDFGKSIDVLLGEDFFDQLDVEFDLPHNVVRLFQAHDCDGVGLAYWASQGAGQVDLAPYYDAGQRIIVEVKVNGRSLRAELDSGARSSVLDKPVAAQIGLTPASAGVAPAGKGGGLGGKAVEFWIAPVESFSIGDETISDTALMLADLWKDATYTPIGSHLPRKLQDTPALLLGADFLRAHRVLVAHSQRKLYFTYEGGAVFRAKAVAQDRRQEPAADAKAMPAEEPGKSASPAK
jgi:predicted aspartyl protease